MPLSIRATVSKFGVAASLIIGAVIGNQLRKKKQGEAMSTGAGGSHRDKALSERERANGGTNILEIYQRLQNMSSSHVPSCPTTTFYMERGKEMCQQFLHLNGFLKRNSEWWMSEWMKRTDWVDGEEYWTKLPPLRPAASPSYTNTLLAALMPLWFLSCSKDFCKGNFTADHSLMLTLKKVLDEKDYAVHPLVLRIIANITAAAEDHKPLYLSGLIDALEYFKNHNTPDVFLPAWRGLLNLNPERSKATGKDIIYQEGVYPYLMPDVMQAGTAEIDVILVHGIQGGAELTWRQRDQECMKPLLTQGQRRNLLSGKFDDDIDNYYTSCWPLDWLVPSMDVPVRILAVDYEANWWHWGNNCPEEALGTVASHGKKIANSLKDAGVGERPIVWITHSMGGLIVKDMLIQDMNARKLENETNSFTPSSASSANKNLSSQTVGIVFFSVPHYGSPLASSVTRGLLRHVLRPSSEVFEMREESLELQELHQSFVRLVDDKSISVLTLNESHPVRRRGLSLLFVPPRHGSSDVGEFHEVDACHIDICKPINRDAESYQKVLSFLQEITRKI